MLKIYNSLEKKKQEFVPIISGHVRMYVCGMTIYDYCHIGHARMMMSFDVIYRWLMAKGFVVTYVRNITDIDDKIIRRSVENGESISQLTSRFIGYMNEDTRALGILQPNFSPRATEYVPQMLRLISTLQEKGYAYQSEGGDVNYSVRKFSSYGQLSGKSIDDLRQGTRDRLGANLDETKNDPLDFVLWKSAKADEPADAKWDSVWGIGRPGWHIECSAMSCALLGESFDIHGGGADLQFPHHENELAQSEAATGVTMVNYWIHNGFVKVDGEKMAKSLGNFFTIRDVLKKYDAEVIRFFILRSHYRSPLNYSNVHLDDARAALTRLYTALSSTPQGVVELDWSNEYAKRFAAAMDDDFNTAEALAVLFDLSTEVNRTREPVLGEMLRGLGGVLGILGRSAEEFLKAAPESALSVEEIEEAVSERVQLRASRDFQGADAIRVKLASQGVIVEDGPAGAVWRRA